MRAQKENVDDVKFIRAVLDDVATGNPVDRGRVFATGISNGGFMVHRVAAEAADIVAAIAPVVGGLAPAIGEKFNPRQPVSILIIQGDADPVVPIDGGDVVIGNGPSRGKVLPTKETLTKYLARNGNRADAVAPTVAPGPRQGTSVQEFKYPDGPGGVKTYYYIVKQGGHNWFGAGQGAQPNANPAQGFQATNATWDFFKTCPPRVAVAGN
jgi:polyhydroxybutyrate depolymerase